MAFASPDRMRPHDGHRFNPNKLVVDPYATAIVSCCRVAIFAPPLATIRRRLRKTCRSPTSTMRRSAPKCVITHADFDWQGDQPLRQPGHRPSSTSCTCAATPIDPSAGVQVPGTYRGLIEKIPYLKDLGVTAVELMPVQEFNEHDLVARQPDTPVSGSRTSGDTIRLASSRPRPPTPAFARTARRSWNSRRWSAPFIARARSDPRRRLQPHRAKATSWGRRCRSAASTTRSTTGWTTTSAIYRTSPARDKPSTRATRSCAISSSTRCATG